MTEIKIVVTYPHPVELVWRAVTDPAVIPQWTATGRGGTPVGFEPVVGNEFRLIGRPMPGWDGIVRSEVLEVSPPSLLRYDWRGAEGDVPSQVSYALRSVEGGTEFTFLHTGFIGLANRLVARLVLTPVRRKMLTVGLPPVLDELAGHQ